MEVKEVICLPRQARARLDDLHLWIKFLQYIDDLDELQKQEKIGRRCEQNERLQPSFEVKYGKNSGSHISNSDSNYIEVLDWGQSIAFLYKTVDKKTEKFSKKDIGVLTINAYLTPFRSDYNPFDVYIGQAIYLGEIKKGGATFQRWFLMNFELSKKVFLSEYRDDRCIKLDLMHIVYLEYSERAVKPLPLSDRPRKRQAIEHYAMKRCADLLKKMGANINDVHTIKMLGYDIEAEFDGNTLYIEIKGLMGDEFKESNLRESQIRCSEENPNWVLAVVTNIILQKHGDAYIGTSGKVSFYKRVNNKMKKSSILV